MAMNIFVQACRCMLAVTRTNDACREGEWVREANMRHKRIYASAACSGWSLYALGGCGQDGTALDSVERLDLRSGEWVEDERMQITRTYSAAVVVTPPGLTSEDLGIF